MKILITSGGTRVPIDDVRYIGNMSTGRLGAELVESLHENWYNEHHVTLFRAKDSIAPKIEEDIHFQGRKYLNEGIFKNYDEYTWVVDYVKGYQPDLIISAAAVSDYVVDKIDGKISSDSDEMVIKLKKAKKILPMLREVSSNSTIVGFKLLVEPTYQEVHKAVKKVLNNGANYVVYNDLSKLRKGDSTRLIFNKNMEHWEAKTPTDIMRYLINEVENKA